jgi:hypothetical protein
MHCLVDGVGDYYGITTRPFRREWEHKRKKKGYKLAAAIALYGPENFTYEVICRCGAERDARRIEREHIQQFNTGWPNGLNVACAGAGVYSRGGHEKNYENRRKAQIAAWEDEAKRLRHSARLLCAMNTPSAKQRNSDAAKRRWANPEYRARQSVSSTGKQHSEATKEKLRQIKLVASAARGGAKDPRKYPGLSRSEIGRINSARPEVQAKIQATRKKNGSNSSPKLLALIKRMATDPAIKAKREKSRRLYLDTHPRKPVSAETRAKMSASRKAAFARRQLESMQPQGSA